MGDGLNGGDFPRAGKGKRIRVKGVEALLARVRKGTTARCGLSSGSAWLANAPPLGESKARLYND